MNPKGNLQAAAASREQYGAKQGTTLHQWLF